LLPVIEKKHTAVTLGERQKYVRASEWLFLVAAVASVWTLSKIDRKKQRGNRNLLRAMYKLPAVDKKGAADNGKGSL
jgi:hypothetical protein